jgi:hypothetical protein
MRTALLTALIALAPLGAQAATEGKRVSLKGELIDTWCYFSGVMGGPDAVVGSAHHTCAMWCAAGGIPVGMLGEDGEVYMILKLPDEENSVGGDTFVELTNDVIEADGMMYERDGLKYLVVSEITSNDGVANLTHEDYGVIPGFAIPKKKIEAVTGEAQ